MHFNNVSCFKSFKAHIRDLILDIVITMSIIAFILFMSFVTQRYQFIDCFYFDLNSRNKNVGARI